MIAIAKYFQFIIPLLIIPNNLGLSAFVTLFPKLMNAYEMSKFF